MEDSVSQIKELVSDSPNLSYNIALTIGVIVALWLLYFIIIRIVNRKFSSVEVQYKWRKNLSYIASFIGFLIIGRIWFEGVQSIATFLGLLTAGLAIALRGPVTDIAGWLFIIWRKPFSLGDRIQINDTKGDVIDRRLFKFTILEIGNWVHADQSTGRVVHIPNHKVFSDSLSNYTSDFKFIWNELEVLVTFESDWKKAKKMLQEIADQHLQDFVAQAQQEIRQAKKSYLIHYQYLTPIVYTDVRDDGICLTIRHLTDPRKRRSTSQSMWEDILIKFERHEDINLAYPTVRIYRQNE